MKITIIQADTHWMARSRNAADAKDMIERVVGSDLYVLPEMWDTGFNTSPKYADADGALRSLQWMQDMAQQTKSAVCGSMMVLDEEGCNSGRQTFHNRMFFVRPDGSFTYYDKHHLFTHGGEKVLFAPGNQRVIVEWKGWRFLLLVCYDLRFPIWSRYNGDYDAIINVANWPLQRQLAWDVLCRARAIENQCYFIGCNRTGGDNTNNYAGHSCIIAPDGTTVAQATTGMKQTVSANIRKQDLIATRISFNVLNDRDNK